MLICAAASCHPQRLTAKYYGADGIQRFRSRKWPGWPRTCSLRKLAAGETFPAVMSCQEHQLPTCVLSVLATQRGCSPYKILPSRSVAHGVT